MDPAILRILDANLNRAREALRVMEEHARMVLGDAGLSAELKQMRHDLARAAATIGPAGLLAARDTPGDVGTGITTASERSRDGAQAVAAAACKRAAEALRCIEEYGKLAATDMGEGGAMRSSDAPPNRAPFSTIVESLRYRVYSAEQALLLTGPRRVRLAEARLHVVLTEALCRRPWHETARAALGGGAGVIQLREKSLGDAALLERARALRELTRAAGALLVINDRADVARLCEADGVHLGRDDLPVAAARAIAGPTVLVGCTAHSEAEIRSALAAGADYVGVGPMFASATKPGVAVNGPGLLRRAIEIVREANASRADAVGDSAGAVPVVAIGGISAENVDELLRAVGVGRARGGAGFSVAVCQGVIARDDSCAAAVRQIMAQLLPDENP